MGKDAVSINADTFAFFTRNPRGKAKDINHADVDALAAKPSLLYWKRPKNLQDFSWRFCIESFHKKRAKVTIVLVPQI